MAKGKSIAVIGAGIIGAHVALRLQADGHSVTLYDPESPGKGCSFGNGGFIATDEVLPLARPELLASVPRMLLNPSAPFTVHWPSVPGLVPWFVRFARACGSRQVARGTAVMDRLLKATPAAWEKAAELAELAPLLKANGFLRVFESEAGIRRFQPELEVQRAHDVPVEVLNPAEVRERIPALTSAVKGGLYYPAGKHLTDPHRAVEKLVTAFKKRGGVFERQPVRAFTRAGERIVAVRSPAGRQNVDAAVIAAGVTSRRLLGALGLNLPLTSERGYHVMIDGHIPGLETPFVPVERGMIITPMIEGTRFGGTVEFAGPGVAATARRADKLLRSARELFADTKIVETSRWMGERPTLPDYLPAIGPLRQLTNLYVATGHQHLGVTLGAVTGTIIARMIDGDEGPEWGALAPDRFN
jgi:D-amino-acid dehydrogenase